MWDYNKSSNIHIRVPGEEKKESTKEVLGQIMVENFPNLQET